MVNALLMSLVLFFLFFNFSAQSAKAVCVMSIQQIQDALIYIRAHLSGLATRSFQNTQGGWVLVFGEYTEHDKNLWERGGFHPIVGNDGLIINLHQSSGYPV